MVLPSRADLLNSCAPDAGSGGLLSVPVAFVWSTTLRGDFWVWRIGGEIGDFSVIFRWFGDFSVVFR